ncbi:MAG: right-handed parallel beta-helix repeat-containing protein [Planctomycetota bacterium]|nr:right-handed parallel beta-helix repeat-containing protein [Planctomycetota bacterium]
MKRNLKNKGNQVNRYSLATGVFIVLLAGSVSQLLGEERPAVAVWNFDGDLLDRSGRSNDAFANAPSFAPGHSAQGLQFGRDAVVVPDSPELRPAPGLRIECWAKLEALGTSWQQLLIKEGAYQLRVDPPREGGQFSFFLHLGQWEPRVRSKTVAQVGVWYHLLAGWDGKEIWIDVDGQRVSERRSGVPAGSGEPLELGPFAGILDELRIENPGAQFSGVAQWLFDGNLHDSSGHGYDLLGKDVEFAPVPGGQALKSGSRSVHVASHPQLQLAPGFRIDGSLYFEQTPAGSRIIAIKNGEYQLRVNSPEEGGCFAFFVNLDGWEPRVCSDQRVVPGRWYRLTARWDGLALTLDVNGRRTRVVRSGLPKPTDNPLVIGGLGGRIDNLKIENPRLPTLLVRDARQEHAILCVGRPEQLTTSIRNVGTGTEQVVVRFELPPGTRCLGAAVHELGSLPTGAEKTIAWTVAADTASIGTAEIRVTAADSPPVTSRHPLVFFPSEAGPPTSASTRLVPPRADAATAVTYYVDSAAGNNANSGTSSDAPWQDFTNVNARTLGPGERLLIRRGSMLNQELTVSARGTADNWAEIGAYGSGPRPTIRRNWDLGDRCALVRNPDFLRIRSLVVCHAAKGLIVSYTESGHRGLLIEDCIAHHIEGLYRPNAHGIPEWRDRQGPTGDGLSLSVGIAITGATATDLVLRDCEMFQCSSGYFVRGDDAIIERVFCHDNFVHNTSPHPFVVDVRRAVLRNSIFDAAGWHASAGTMGIMLGDPQGLIIRNCLFRNQPDSGSHDQGGIDFENRGNGCLIEHCTFQNNAGAAIEVLGLKSPQPTNLEIRNSRFIQNNTAKKLGPSEIFIWGGVRDPAVCCSTGLIHGNGYVTLPGIEFFINEAPELTSWTLRDNTSYATVEELNRARPFNRPPVVDAGADIRIDQRRVRLLGSVSDDGQPAGQPLSIAWEVLEGPGSVAFDDVRAPGTMATFDRPGDYLLRLVADDGEFWLSDLVVVHVLPAGTSVAAAWEFNTNLDKAGWTEMNLGTRIQQWPNQDWPTTSHPVNYVAGGYYVVAIENSSDAHLLSPDHLGVDLTGHQTVTIRFQNHTPAEQLRLKFTTEADGVWDAAKSRTFTVVANDNGSRTYALDMSAVPAWKGHLRQLRLDLATGQPLTGTCRFDYVWITSAAARP